MTFVISDSKNIVVFMPFTQSIVSPRRSLGFTAIVVAVPSPAFTSSTLIVKLVSYLLTLKTVLALLLSYFDSHKLL